MTNATLEPDRDQLEIFADAVMRHRGREGQQAAQADGHGEAQGHVGKIPDRRGRRSGAAGGQQSKARGLLRAALRVQRPEGWQAREEDLFKGLALSVECDQHPHEARRKLEDILGPATAIVRSGGQWINGDGTPEDKLHLHRRLKTPAESAKLKVLKEARELATAIAGGDISNVPVVHCLRWPGSWHRKSTPRLCELISVDPDREIDLDIALAELRNHATPTAAPERARHAQSGPDCERPADPSDWNILVGNIIAGRELHHSIVRLAAKYVRSSTPAGVAINQMRALMENSVARTERPAEWRTRYDDIGRAFESAKGKQKSTYETYTVESLRTKGFPMLKRIAGDIIVEGLTLLAARPKVGKTWFALDIATAVDRNGYCLGDIKCDQGDVLFLALEDNKRRMQRRLTKLLGINKTEWPRFSCAHTWARADQGGLDHIRAWIAAAKNPRLVVVDVLARFRKIVPSGKQSYDADYEAIAGLQKIASDTGVAILVIHHTRKGEADDPIDAVSGTLGLAGAADAVLVIDRNAQGVRLYGRSRDVDEIDKAMTFDRGTCRWTILGERADVQRTSERQQIISALRDESEPMTAKDIAIVTGQKPGNNRRLLLKMAKDGEITRVKRGSYTLPATGNNSSNAWWKD